MRATFTHEGIKGHVHRDPLTGSYQGHFLVAPNDLRLFSGSSLQEAKRVFKDAVNRSQRTQEATS